MTTRGVPVKIHRCFEGTQDPSLFTSGREVCDMAKHTETIAEMLALLIGGQLEHA